MTTEVGKENPSQGWAIQFGGLGRTGYHAEKTVKNQQSFHS
jgi:hypothetical protein